MRISVTSRLSKRRGTGPDGLSTEAGENRQAKRSGAKRKRYFWAGSLVLIVGIVVYGLFITDLLGGSRAAGEPAPDVTLNTMNGEFRLSQQRGKVLVLYFSFPG